MHSITAVIYFTSINYSNIQSPAKGSKTSKASDFSKNETNKTPMELQSPQNQPKQKKWFVKKFFMKIGERVGTVKQTEFDDEYLAAVKEVDEYYVRSITIYRHTSNCLYLYIIHSRVQSRTSVINAAT